MEQNTEYVYTLKQTSQFKKDLKAVKFDEHKLDELQKVLEHLGHTGMVPSEYMPHPLKGQYKNCMECHIEDDFLLIWKDPEQKVIRLVRLGTHSKLFDKQRKRQRKPGQKTSSILHQPSSIPLHLQAVSNLCNQLLRAGTSIGAKQLLEQ